MMDGVRSDAGMLRAKAMYNWRSNFPSYTSEKTTPQKLHINSKKKTLLISDLNSSKLAGTMASYQQAELNSTRNCQVSMKAPSKVVERHAQLQDRMLATPALCKCMICL